MAATPTTTPRRGSSGRMTFSLQRLPEPLILEQDTIDPKWNKFKTYFGICVGGFCFMAWVVFLSFQWGRAGQAISTPVAIQQTYTVPAVQQPTAYEPPAPAPARELTPEELDRLHSERLRNQNR